jgi:hypothetical protein
VNFSPYVAQALAARGWFRVSADTAEMVELFQKAVPAGPVGSVGILFSPGPRWD